MDGICFVLALGARKFKGAGHTTQASARESPNDVRLHARLKMLLSMLLEGAIRTDQARPSSKLGRLEILNRESERRALVNKGGAQATKSNMNVPGHISRGA